MAQARNRRTATREPSQLAQHITHGLREVGFLVTLLIGAYLAVALLSYDAGDAAWTQTGSNPTVTNLAGIAGAWFADIVMYFLGFAGYLLPAAVAFVGWALFKRGRLGELDAELVGFRLLGFVVSVGAGSGLVGLLLRNGGGHSLAPPGGIFGGIVSEGLIGLFGRLGGSLLVLALFLAGVVLATGLSWGSILRGVYRAGLWLIDATGKLSWWIGSRTVGLVWRGCQRLLTGPARDADRAGDEGQGETTEPAVVGLRATRDRPEATESVPILREERKPAGGAVRVEPVMAGEPPPVPTEPTRTARPTAQPAAPAAPARMERPAAARREVAPVVIPADAGPLPPLALLSAVPPGQVGYTPEVLEEMSRQVEVRLGDFGIEVRVVAVEPGPVITRFELEPAPGVKVSQISNLAKDLARGLSVMSVRVVEVIPGKSVIGLEIPNQRREIVYLAEVLGSPAYEKSTAPLTLALGKDIGGTPRVANLAKMPHLLVAGTTGSGKSVAINAMLLSMLYKATPEEVRLILVDPKMLELSVYEGIPHLLAPVVTDMKDAANALRWCVAEMERRYRLMAAMKVRNIAGFNKLAQDAINAGEPLRDPFAPPAEQETGEPLRPLPFIVVVIDELADMMMVVGKKVEELIARLAQKARASGIHLILATQRPSVDVITGLIKANIPTRVAFQVSSKIDSRTILDQQGAEHLLGHGDMLYLPPGTGFPQRMHGAFVDDHEVNRVVEYLKSTGEPDYIDDILEEPLEASGGSAFSAGLGGGDASGGESDPLYDQAVHIVTESRRASISGVQRRLKIGYNRAARLIEEMEAAGIVGALQPNGSRDVIAPPPPKD